MHFFNLKLSFAIEDFRREHNNVGTLYRAPLAVLDLNIDHTLEPGVVHNSLDYARIKIANRLILLTVPQVDRVLVNDEVLEVEICSTGC